MIITQYIGFDDPVVVIPSTINGMRVNEIGSKAFYGCKSLTEVVFEEPDDERVEFFSFNLPSFENTSEFITLESNSFIQYPL